MGRNKSTEKKSRITISIDESIANKIQDKANKTQDGNFSRMVNYVLHLFLRH